MRRALASLILAAVLVLGAATTAAAFSVGTYGGHATDGGRVIFTNDTTHAHGFSWEGRPLFDNAAIEHHDGVWRFHTHSTRWQVHGHWLDRDSVEGSICALDSDGSCPSEHLHHYTAELKTVK